MRNSLASSKISIAGGGMYPKTMRKLDGSQERNPKTAISLVTGVS
jgi:hypothetical protein